jgi:hypothetical protein
LAREEHSWFHGAGIIPRNTYACNITSSPIRTASARLCQNTERNTVPASGLSGRPPVATLSTTMLWASIIFPITPPELLDAVVRIGESISCRAVTCCKFPKRTLDEVSLPVSAVPSHPMSGEKKGKSEPVAASVRPMVVSVPLKRVVKPSASIRAMVSNEMRIREIVRP